jgi:hypothetical protein
MMPELAKHIYRRTNWKKRPSDYWRIFRFLNTTFQLFFYCAVALCTIQNALLVISNLTWYHTSILLTTPAGAK